MDKHLDNELVGSRYSNEWREGDSGSVMAAETGG